jgi:predicted nucleic acid-binding protein
LKKKGNPIPGNDLWIAASAMRHGLALFTHDNHFSNIDGLLLHEGV